MAVVRCKNCGYYIIDDIQQRPLVVSYFKLCPICSSNWFDYDRPGFELTEEERRENAKARCSYDEFKKKKGWLDKYEKE